MSRAPNRFVGLHSHSTFSTYDAIGRPQDHIDFAIKNGSDALALTDHGNMNGFSHQYFHAKKLEAKGIPFKPIFGIEAYFIPSFEEWEEHRRARQIENATERALKAAKKKSKKNNELGNELAATEAELAEIAEEKAEDEADTEEDSGGTIVEDENESKSRKADDPVKQRNHLVILAKNDAGLKSLFRMVSESASEGFYNVPRMDLGMLKKYANGNLVVTTACVAGLPAKIVFSFQEENDWMLWKPNTNRFEEIQASLKEVIEGFQDALGKENYYLEMQFNKLPAQHLLNFHLIEASKRTGAPLVVTCDAHYSDPKHWRSREIYKLMNPKFMKRQDENLKNLPKTIDELKSELYPKNAQQLWESYKATTAEYDFYDDSVVCEAVERTHDIAHQLIGRPEPNRSVKLPAIQKILSDEKIQEFKAKLPEEETSDEDAVAFQAVKHYAIEGLKNRKVAGKQNYVDRLKYELEVIKTLKFAKYFLTYYHIMRAAGEHMLLGNARGSAGGSLLAYVLGITQMDPIKHDLLFERFMTRKKKAFPDIDSDFADREKAVKLLQEFFGEENVIPVSLFAALKPLSLIKDLCKLNGVPFELVNDYTKKMIPEVMSVKKGEPGFDAAQYELTFEDLAEHSATFRRFMKEIASNFPDFQETLDVLWKQQRTIGRHAGGVIITTGSSDSMPLIKAKGGLQTPWPEGLAARHLEDFGLLKFDVLGLGTLRIFEDTITRILKKEGKKYVSQADINKWFFEKLHPDNNPMDDLSVYKNVYWEGRYAGIFQFVKENVQRFMKEMKPKSVLDIAIATSIFRPGPMGLEIELPNGEKVHGAQNMFLLNRKNPSSVHYAHPALKEVLEYTSGLLIFQEQLQLIVNKLSGMHLDDTDSIRKAFTKKDKSNAEKQAKEIKALGEKFVEDSMKHSGISREAAEQVWKDFEKWTAYGFNKSHAMAYAITSYQCAWFLTYYPEEWVASYLDFATDGKGKTASGDDPKSVALVEAQMLGFRFGKPDINFSEDKFAVKEGRLLIPSFSAIKGVGKASLIEIRQHRPYVNLRDLILNKDGTWRHSKFNKKALSHLIKTSAFESMDLVGPGKTFDNYKQMHTVLIENHENLKRIASRKTKNDANAELEALVKSVKASITEDWTIEEKTEFSKELTGQIDASLLLTKKITDFFLQNNIESIDGFAGPSKLHWAIVDSCSQLETKFGKPFLLLTFHGESGAKRKCKVWNFNPDRDVLYKKDDILVLRMEKDDFGLSTKPSSVRILKKKT